MYLVLIALLALNVSREILKSFHLFELSFINGNKHTEARNAEIMQAFNNGMNNEKTRARTEKWYGLAVEARKVSKEFCDYVEKMKADIVERGGGREEAEKGNTELPELKRPDDMEEHAHYFIDGGLANGRKLQNKINETREKLAALVTSARYGEAIRNSLVKKTQLRAVDPADRKSANWVSTYLENAPLAGVVTLLTKTQNDCKALEADVLTVLNENITIESISNNAQVAMIIPENQSVMSGQNFNAKIALMTYDTHVGAQMLVNGQPVTVTNGIGHISIPASGTGTHTLQASIESVDPKTGEPVMVRSEPVTWNSYQASASISADNMNVLFIGLENPMSISVPGVTPENTIVSSTNGIVLRSLGAGRYMARVSGNRTSGNINVSARMGDGSIKSMGSQSYRIRKVPTPKFMLGNLPSGSYEKSTIIAQHYLYAYLEDFYFKDVKFTINKYRLHLVTKRVIPTNEITVHANTLNQAKSLIGQARSGDVIYIDEISASGPSGAVRLEPVTYKIK